MIHKNTFLFDSYKKYFISILKKNLCKGCVENVCRSFLRFQKNSKLYKKCKLEHPKYGNERMAWLINDHHFIAHILMMINMGLVMNNGVYKSTPAQFSTELGSVIYKRCIIWFVFSHFTTVFFSSSLSSSSSSSSSKGIPACLLAWDISKR